MIRNDLSARPRPIYLLLALIVIIIAAHVHKANIKRLSEVEKAQIVNH